MRLLLFTKYCFSICTGLLSFSGICLYTFEVLDLFKGSHRLKEESAKKRGININFVDNLTQKR